MEPLYDEALQHIKETIEFSAWLTREDGLLLPLPTTVAKVGCFPGFVQSDQANRVLLEMEPPEVNRE